MNKLTIEEGDIIFCNENTVIGAKDFTLKVYSVDSFLIRFSHEISAPIKLIIEKIDAGVFTLYKKVIPNKPKQTKDWEITEFLHLADNVVFPIVANDKYVNAQIGRQLEFTLEQMLHKGNCVDTGGIAIKTIKRLSDGEIFTASDKTNFGTIKGFNINGDSLFVLYEDGTQSTLDSVVKVKQPIFTTEDGVGVFEGDRVWYVDGLFKIDFVDFNDGEAPYPNIYKYFSTEEKAKAYVFQNKYSISLKDIMDFDKSRYYINPVKYFEELVKERSNVE